MALSSVDELGFSSRRGLADRSGNLLRTRTVDGIQRIEDRCSEIAVFPGKPAEKDDAFVIGDRSDGVDDLRRRKFSDLGL